MSALHLRVVDSEVEFDALRPAWNRLLDESLDKNLFLSWEWQSTWWKHFGNGRQLNILIVEENGKLTAIAPLVRSRLSLGILNFESLESISYDGGDYGGIILGRRDQESLALISSYLESDLLGKVSIVVFSRILEE